MKGLKAKELNNCLHLLDTRSPIYQKFQSNNSWPPYRSSLGTAYEKGARDFLV